MKGKRYSEDQILSIAREIEERTGVMSTCRKYGVSKVTVHRWRNKYGGMSRSSLNHDFFMVFLRIWTGNNHLTMPSFYGGRPGELGTSL